MNLALTIKVTLPCGHVLEHGYADEHGHITYGAHLLTHWVNDRTERHDCALVSDMNPLGRKPRPTADELMAKAFAERATTAAGVPA